MHKAIYLEGTIKFTIHPDGPVLVKAGETGGADPTRPDMEFVRTKYRVPDSSPDSENNVYIPGPSLKGIIRAQAERICRSLDNEQQQRTRLEHRIALDRKERKELEKLPDLDARDCEELSPPDDILFPLADNPLGERTDYKGLDDMTFSSGRYVESLKQKEGRGKQFNKHPKRTAIIYRRSSFVSQMFGHTSMAGRVRFADAYGKNVKLEERNGVAIDRVYGSVAVGPFNYETVVAGEFETRIDLKNITLAQLALIGLALRDLAEGRVAVGFGKSRGLGRVKVTFNTLSLRYPTCVLQEKNDQQTLCLLGGREIAPADKLVGIGMFEQQAEYGFPDDDKVALPSGMTYQEDQGLGIGVTVCAEGKDAIYTVWKHCMDPWKKTIGWQT